MTILPHTKKQRIAVFAILIAVAALGTAAALYLGIHNAGFAPTEDSFFSAPFTAGKKVLVLVAHPDDDVNLAYGVIDAFARAGSRVTIAFSTNGDVGGDAQVRVLEAVKADALMGVAKDDIVLLGYGGRLSPPFFLSGYDLVRTNESGYTETFGAGGITDYHTLVFGQPAAYTRANYETDIRQLILNLRPDLLFVTDTDDNVDHVSLSQSFDGVMGGILRENSDYRPLVFKGFCYEYAWHGNKDFYHSLTLKSAAPTWKKTSYHHAYAWAERVRFPLPDAYLGYTLRSSRLRKLLCAYASQNAVAQENGLLNGDRVFWERRADALWADVTATSGDAALLQDFRIGDAREAPLRTCWTPDAGDTRPVITFAWPVPQTIAELAFYDAPDPAGDILRVRVEDGEGYAVEYTLPDGSGEPCRLQWNGAATRTLTVTVLKSRGDRIGLSEIEVLPPRDTAAQWIHLLDADGNFLYETAVPAGQAFHLLLYGYPAVPAQASATVVRESTGETVAEIQYGAAGFSIPPLPKGRYRITAVSGDCRVEAVLRVGDSMLKERVLRRIERMADDLL